MSYSRPSCNRSSTNFAATWCGAGISELLTKPLQRTPYHSSTAPTHGASPSKQRLTTLPSISSHPGRDGDRCFSAALPGCKSRKLAIEGPKLVIATLSCADWLVGLRVVSRPISALASFGEGPSALKD